MMLQFLIRPTEVQWVSIPASMLATVCTPQCVAVGPREDEWGDYSFTSGSVEVGCSYEDPGLHITFEEDIEEALAQQIVEEILANITRITGQAGHIVSL